MKIIDLITTYAKEYGYTGLVGNECGCDIDEICPFESGNVTECEFGYRNECYKCADKDTCDIRDDYDDEFDTLYMRGRCFVPIAEAEPEAQEVNEQ